MNDRKKGALLGLAWGDVLGCPVETWRKHEIRSVYGLFTDLPDTYPLSVIPERKKRKLRPPGLHSDDTQQALALLQVCLSHRGWNRLAWKEMLVQGWKREAWRGVGRNFVRAVQQMAKGRKVKVAGSPSAGMGAAMRVGPLGALFCKPEEQERLLRSVLESSLATHADGRAAIFAAVVAGAVAGFVRGESREESLKSLPRYAEEAEAFVTLLKQEGWKVENSTMLLSGPLREAIQWADEPVETMRENISNRARPQLQKGFTRAHPNQGFVLLGGLHGLLMAHRREADPRETLLSIIREGFDTDTVAAIAGTVLGARFGVDWVPDHRLVDKERIGGYAESLFTREVPETMDTFIRRERQLTREALEFQAI
ncbi:ADP-ribosylglycohydrolase family protein [Paludifilum halophilum]|nr:ADP-ribosylglycohydrolase family protein [Paludifilum halophilum]